MPPRRPRTIVFGLDGYDLEFALQRARSGGLAWLNSQIQRGTHVSTRCATLQGSEWVNAACGVSAAQHGFLHRLQIRVGTYEEVETDASAVRADPFYVPLARSGVRSVVVDLPVDRPRPQSNLTQVIDWGTEFQLWGYATTPKDLGRSIATRVGEHLFTNYGTTRPDEASLVRLREKLMRGISQKCRLVRELMRQQSDWTFFFAGFGEIHKAGHFFWQYQDPTHPGYRGPEHPLAGALAELYEILDAALREIGSEVEDDINVLVVTDRGMRANHRGAHFIAPLLQRWGVFTPTGRGDAPSESSSTESHDMLGRRSIGNRIKQRIPVAMRPIVRSLVGRDHANWRETQVFPVPDVAASYLRVNLMGREPQGVVRPGAEYDALLARLELEFKALINPATGRSPVEEVVFPAREFAGPFNDRLPDIGVVWACDAPVKALQSPSIGRIEGRYVEQRSGNHTCTGGILAAGPNFKRRSTRSGDLRELAPTLLSLFSVSIPDTYEYAPMRELEL